MNRRYNPRLIHKRRSYATKEIAGLFGMHVHSVQNWIAKDGLLPIEGISNPYLISGQVLYDFITKRQQKQRCKLQEDELYCLKCRAARKGVPDEFCYIKTEVRIGNRGKFKGTKIGKCEVCHGKICRFFTYEKETSDRII